MKYSSLLSATRVLASVVLCSLPGTVAGFLGMKPIVAEEKQDHHPLQVTSPFPLMISPPVLLEFKYFLYQNHLYHGCDPAV